MGAATCWYLAKRGQKVLGLEQFSTPHENGSHAGQSRIIRKAYFEHPDYVPLLERAYENWRAFESETSSQFYHKTGIVYFGERENENIAGIRRSAQLHGIGIENWSHLQYKENFPQFDVPSAFDVIYEPDAGFVTPEQAIRMYVKEARKHGGVVMENTAVTSWKLGGGKVRVSATDRDYTSDKLVITSGAWSARMIPQINVSLEVTRQLLAWVAPPDPSAFAMGNFPCWFIEDPGLGTFYGFPILADGVGPIGLKLAHHHPGIPTDANYIRHEIPGEEEKLKRFLRKYIPSAGDKIIHTKHCLYTYSPDSHFIIDHLPGFDKMVVIACGFSGHGFKFVPVIGEALADLAMKGMTDLPIEFLKIARF